LQLLQVLVVFQNIICLVGVGEGEKEAPGA